MKASWIIHKLFTPGHCFNSAVAGCHGHLMATYGLIEHVFASSPYHHLEDMFINKLTLLKQTKSIIYFKNMKEGFIENKLW